MTNKPMLSVELRSVLSMILNALDRDAEEGKVVRCEMAQELRAHLDKEVDGNSCAPKQHGEAVGEVVHVSEDQIRISLYEEYSLKVGDLVWAEQPAPVAVVLPGRKVDPHRHQRLITPGCGVEKGTAEGWNACLAEVAKLNGLKPSQDKEGN